MASFLKKAIVDRVRGRKPSRLRALAAAVVAGVAAAVATYEALRG
ncbi:MAG: hypothetical protein ACJ768_15560 [Gaiellaceae bacterium]